MYEALYEIAISIGTSLQLEKMLKRFNSSLIINIDLQGSAIYRIDKNRHIIAPTIFSPRSFSDNYKLTKALAIFQEDKRLSEIEVDGLFFYRFYITNYGYNIFATESKLGSAMLNHLPEVYIKLAIAIQSAVLNADLQKKVEDELVKHRRRDILMFQQAKLTSIAELMGNISHQWRQPLNNISLLIQDIKDAYDYDEIDDEYIEKFLEETMENISTMSLTIDNFRSFFSESNSKLTEFSIREVIEDGVKMLKDNFSSNEIHIIFKLCEDFTIFGNKIEFAQVILNMLNNSRDILTERWIQDASVWITIDRDLRRVIIEDNGGGIEDEHLPKVCEPYFTTKHQSAGTGIGMYMAKIIVERNLHGILRVENEKHGAKFTMTFPG
jgi:signal transduction histidine kinase